MFISILKNINLQIIISYFGVFPFFFIFLDLYIFELFSINLLKDFLIYYILIIFSFIGAMRWNFSLNFNFVKTLYGFLPSLISTIIIIYNLLSYSKSLIFIAIFFFLTLQLIFDFIIYKSSKSERNFFFGVRLPVTLIVLINIIYIILV